MDYIRMTRGEAVTVHMIAQAIEEYCQRIQPTVKDLRNLYFDSKIHFDDYKDGLSTTTIERLNFPIARYITTIRTNHMLGNPVKYEQAQDAESNIEASLTEIKRAYKRQSKSKLDKELKRECGRCGFAYEVAFIADKNGSLQVKSAMLPTENTLVVFDDSVEMDSIFACSWHQPNTNAPYTVTVYTDSEIMEYETSTLYTFGEYKLKDEPKPHYFGRVPVTMWTNNDSCLGDYEGVAPLIHALNGIMTDSRYDIKKNVDGLLVFLNTKLAGASVEEKAKIRRAIKDLGVLELNDDEQNPSSKADVKTLSSPLNYAGVDVYVDRVWRSIFTLAGVPDPLRTEYFTSLSGVALKMQLFMGLKPFAQDSENNIEYALKRRLKMYSVGMSTQEIDVADVDIVFTYTEPSNDLEVAQIVTYLAGRGVATTETLSRQLSFVEDAVSEVEAAKAEMAANTNSDILSQLSMFETTSTVDSAQSQASAPKMEN